MKRLAMWAAAAGAAVALSAGAARAQFGYYSPPATSPFPRSPISPYLNLARGGNPAINYYGLVRPQIETQQSIYGLRQQVGGLSQMQVLQSEAARSSATTGHPTRFFNYSHYFMNTGGGGGGFPGARGLGTPIQGVGNNGLGVGQSPLIRGGGAQGMPGRR